jgi:hypothetical protein
MAIKTHIAAVDAKVAVLDMSSNNVQSFDSTKTVWFWPREPSLVLVLLLVGKFLE